MSFPPVVADHLSRGPRYRPCGGSRGRTARTGRRVLIAVVREPWMMGRRGEGINISVDIALVILTSLAGASDPSLFEGASRPVLTLRRVGSLL
jgi:hypothetical protein